MRQASVIWPTQKIMDQGLLIAIALAGIRLIVGFMFFFQGYDKVFNIGLRNLIQTLHTTLSSGSMSKNVVAPVAVVSSYIELVAGMLVAIGFLTPYALSALCLNLVMVSIGFSKYKPMWDESHVFVRLILVVTLMISPREWDLFTLDHLIK
jgi:uncharacterized membrane protein YphA (DoxX/SURF4 family)